MFRTTQSVVAMQWQQHLMTGLEFTLDANTTLNEKYTINGHGVEENKIAFFGIGSLNQPVTTPLQLTKIKQRPTDADLVMPIPFLVKPITTPLTEIEKETYFMRSTEDIDGELYVCCYLKKVVINRPTIKTIKTTPASGNIVTPYIQPPNVLTPTITDYIDVTINEAIEYIMVSQKVSCEITSIDKANIEQAMNLKYPSVSKIIDSFGIYNGRTSGSTLEPSEVFLNTSIRKSVYIENLSNTFEFDISNLTAQATM